MNHENKKPEPGSYEAWLQYEAEQFKQDIKGGFYDEQPGLTDEQVWELKDAEEGGY